MCWWMSSVCSSSSTKSINAVTVVPCPRLAVLRRAQLGTQGLSSRSLPPGYQAAEAWGLPTCSISAQGPSATTSHAWFTFLELLTA